MAFSVRVTCVLLFASAVVATAQPAAGKSSFNLVLVFVDFVDGRRPDGSLPASDADLKYFNDTTINAAGGMGYVNVNPKDSRCISRCKCK
jgi:hypothetical protein